jgi:SnoaL-like protein
MDELCEMTVAAMRLQNLCALALDTRNVEMFASVFTDDAVLVYPRGTPYTDQETVGGWLTHLSRRPVGYRWWQHAMLSHTAGWETDGERDRAWAVCYGFCRVIREDNPDVISVSHAVYRDRLVRTDGSWKIRHRTASLLMKEWAPVRPGQEFLRPGAHIPHSMLDDEVGSFV